MIAFKKRTPVACYINFKSLDLTLTSLKEFRSKAGVESQTLQDYASALMSLILKVEKEKFEYRFLYAILTGECMSECILELLTLLTES